MDFIRARLLSQIRLDETAWINLPLVHCDIREDVFLKAALQEVLASQY